MDARETAAMAASSAVRRRAAELLVSAVDLASWRAANASSFAPPICNKLLHKADLSVMCVGGPNTRTDFHLEDGAEFFWQMEGEMELPIVERGRRRLVKIRQGDVFLLPPRVPVSLKPFLITSDSAIHALPHATLHARARANVHGPRVRAPPTDPCGVFRARAALASAHRQLIWPRHRA